MPAAALDFYDDLEVDNRKPSDTQGRHFRRKIDTLSESHYAAG